MPFLLCEYENKDSILIFTYVFYFVCYNNKGDFYEEN